MDGILIELLNSYYSQEKHYVSGEELGDKLGISRAAIWKHIDALRTKGFDIQPHRKKGYRLESLSLERIVPEAIAVLYRNFIGNTIRPVPEIYYYPKIGSTNTEAKRLAIDMPDKHFIVVTDEQTSGKGRLKRSWLSDAGLDLTFTIHLPLDCELSDYFRYTLLSVNSVHKALSFYADSMTIKWPNDIYASGKKICGILSETVTEHNRIKSFIIGAGINVNSKKTDGKAVSLLDIYGETIDRNLLLASILKEFYSDLALVESGFDGIYKYWKTRLIGLNRAVRFDTGKTVIEGILADVERDGSVVIRTDKGEEKYYSGDLYTD